MKKITLIALPLILSLLSHYAYASGTYGGGSYNRSAEQRQVDQTYESGKAIFRGRASSAGKLKYCVSVDGELLPVKRSSLKGFKNTKYSDVANQLFNCDLPDKKIAEQLTKDEFLYVIYYLNKRFKLNLS